MPNAVDLVPFGGAIGIPECSAGETAAVDGDAPAAGGGFEVIAIVLSGIVGAVLRVLHRPQIGFHTGIVAVQLVLKIGQLTIDGRIVIAVGPAPALKTAIAAARPLTEAVAAAACIPGVRVKGGFTADIGHDPAGCRLRIAKLLGQIFKNIVGVLTPCRCCRSDCAGTARREGTRKGPAHQQAGNAPGRLCFTSDPAFTVFQIESLPSARILQLSNYIGNNSYFQLNL